MTFFYDATPPRRSRPTTLIVVALVAFLAGGALVAAGVPWYIDQRLDEELASRLPGPTINGEPVPMTSPGGEEGGEWPVVYIAEKVRPTVVGVITIGRVYNWLTDDRYEVEKGSGSGVIFDKRGYIVTNYHVVEGAAEGTDRLLVMLEDGRRIPAELVGADKVTDLAVIKVDPGDKPIQAAEFGDSDQLKVGELAVAIGNPVGKEFAHTVTAGVISGLDRVIQYGEQELGLIQTDAAINPGNSGGPLVNAQGQVVGINSVKLVIQGVEGMGFAIPSTWVQATVKQLMEHGRVIRPWLGVLVTEPDAAAQYYDAQVEEGLFVVKAYVGQPAHAAGIRAGDIILSVGGRDMKTTDDLRQAIKNAKVGDRLSIVILRDGRQTTVTATLSEMPPNVPR